MKENIGRLLVFVRPELDNGPILIHNGCFSDEVMYKGWDVSDHNMPCANVMGLQIFEGFLEVIDEEVILSGSYRQLTHYEMCRLRAGLIPWSD